MVANHRIIYPAEIWTRRSKPI